MFSIQLNNIELLDNNKIGKPVLYELILEKSRPSFIEQAEY